MALSQSWNAASFASARMSPEMAKETSLLRGVWTGSDLVPVSAGESRQRDWLAEASLRSSSHRTASLRKASRFAVSMRKGSGISTE